MRSRIRVDRDMINKVTEDHIWSFITALQTELKDDLDVRFEESTLLCRSDEEFDHLGAAIYRVLNTLNEERMRKSKLTAEFISLDQLREAITW